MKLVPLVIFIYDARSHIHQILVMCVCETMMNEASILTVHSFINLLQKSGRTSCQLESVSINNKQLHVNLMFIF